MTEENEFDGDLNPEQAPEIGPNMLAADALTVEDITLSTDADDEGGVMEDFYLPTAIVKEICEASQHYNADVLKVLVSHGLAALLTSDFVSDEEAQEFNAASTYTQQ